MIDYSISNACYFSPQQLPRLGLFRRVNLGWYYPPFRTRLIRVKCAAAARGSEYVSEFGYRPIPQQAQLHALWLAGKGGRAAPAGLSAHQYGLADDSTADADTHTPGLQPTWAPEAYAVLGEEAAREGLVWGASFGDRPHVQWPGFVDGHQLQALLHVWSTFAGDEDEKLRAVWAWLDAQPQPG